MSNTFNLISCMTFKVKGKYVKVECKMTRDVTLLYHNSSNAASVSGAMAPSCVKLWVDKNVGDV